MRSIDVAFRGCKFRLKKDHFYAYPNDEIRRAKKPTSVPEPIFEDLLVYWNSEEAEDPSKTNKENRKKFKYPHTMGKTSFTLIREEKKMKNSGALSNKEFFVATRTRKPDRIYKDTFEEITNKIVEMERVETQESEDGTQSSDAFTKFMGPDHHGRVRLLERGGTKTFLKQKASDSGSSSKSDELVEKRLDELEERMQQRMNAQRDVIEREVTMNIIAQLQHLNPGLILDPNMLGFYVHSSGEAFANQQGNRPSVDCNNQGVQNEERDEKNDEDIDHT
ncbi:hypothetical protein P3S68_003344 [Capsicum galapagoense]